MKLDQIPTSVMYVGGGALLGYLLGKNPTLTALLGAGIGWMFYQQVLKVEPEQLSAPDMELDAKQLKEWSDKGKEVLEPDEIVMNALDMEPADYDPLGDTFGPRY